MPVKILYCEGISNGIDAEILSKILDNICLVKPVGTKRILPQRTLGARDVKLDLSGAAMALSPKLC